MRRFLILLVLMGAHPTPASDPRDRAGERVGDERRVALVIGNGAYASGALRNPPNDARLIASRLSELGFSVTLLNDAGRDRMRRAILDFGEALQAGGVGLFYYAGHGVQARGHNYLIPIDASLGDETRIQVEAIDMDEVSSEMATAGNRLNILVLDACRNNPFPSANRSASRGLATLAGPAGTFIAYSASSDQVAEDGAGDNSTFSAAFARNMARPGADLNRVFDEVRNEVYQATRHAQVPESRSMVVGGSFYFRSPKPASSESEKLPARDPGPTGTKGRLSSVVISVQGGGEVSLDGSPRGTVAPRGRLWVESLEPGWHIFSVGTESRRIELQEGQTLELSLVGDSGDVRAKAGIVWASVPGGRFSMGSNEGKHFERPLHEVRVPSFEMSATEVTVRQYRACVDARVCQAPTSCDFGEPNWGAPGREDHPVNCVDWNQARIFASWAGGRLPSEAEWEYAARSDPDTANAGSAALDEVAWYAANSGGSTHPVASRKAWSLGIHDLRGNVWEWVQDWHHGDYTGAPTDGSAWTGEGSLRVVRGGSAGDSPETLGLTNRRGMEPDTRHALLGFRVCRSMEGSR